MRDGSILDYCRLHDITIQPWSPFQYGFFEGTFLDNPKFPELNQKIDEMAAQYRRHEYARSPLPGFCATRRGCSRSWARPTRIA
jgi:predicted oxidoreductase